MQSFCPELIDHLRARDDSWEEHSQDREGHLLAWVARQPTESVVGWRVRVWGLSQRTDTSQCQGKNSQRKRGPDSPENLTTVARRKGKLGAKMAGLNIRWEGKKETESRPNGWEMPAWPYLVLGEPTGELSVRRQCPLSLIPSHLLLPTLPYVWCRPGTSWCLIWPI